MKGAVMAGLALGALGLPFAAHESTYRMNWTNSVPVGLYRAQVAPGAYLAFCLPADQLRIALKAGLELGSGECPDGNEPLLKTVYRASADSPITLDVDGFTVDGRRLNHTAPKAFSKSGKPLRAYRFGTYTSGLWAISSYSTSSYDSRYFGPVPQQSVRFYAHPVLTF
jgi:conjugative transfer signal peptidase TraF